MERFTEIGAAAPDLGAPECHLDRDRAQRRALVMAVAEVAPEARTPGGNRANAEDKQERSNSADSASPDAKRKAFERLRAELALAGRFTLIEQAGGDYVVALGGYTRSLPDLRAVTAFLGQVSGAKQ